MHADGDGWLEWRRHPRTARVGGRRGLAEIVRTRDPEVLKTLDIVVDVGGVYEPATYGGSGQGGRHTPAAALTARERAAGTEP